MSFRHGALAPLLLLIASALVVAEEPSFAPQQGALLLRNGSVLQGKVLRLGDRYLVTFGGRSELFVDVSEVLTHCHSLEEAYDFQRDALQTDSAPEHLRLARWCLRHRLLTEAENQLRIAREIDSRHPGIANLERQLNFALRPPTPTPKKTDSVTPAIIDLQQIQRELAQLPSRVIERFTVSVQPILMNRCSNAACHGPRSPSQFQLLRPQPGMATPRRFTQRNLYATLRTIDRSAPEKSPLLLLPRSPHGGVPTAIFSQREHRQYEQLLAWVDQVTQMESASNPRVVAKPNSVLLQSATSGSFPRSIHPTPAENPSTTTKDQNRSPQRLDTLPRSAVSGGYVPIDPFDPELFNRRFHKTDSDEDDAPVLERPSSDTPSSPASR